MLRSNADERSLVGNVLVNALSQVGAHGRSTARPFFVARSPGDRPYVRGSRIRLSTLGSGWMGITTVGKGGESPLTKVKRLCALLLAVCAFAASVAPAAFGDAGGGPGSNAGCPGHQPPPPPHGGCGH
jgi:hypothetical protein